jgi:hypothetical protein
MQTIKITITSSTPANIVVKECRPKDQDVVEKLAVLLKGKQVLNKVKKEK